MKSNADPILHREREQQLMQHVVRLLEDDRLRVDTTLGSRPIKSLLRDVERTDRGVELKRLMSEMGMPDRDLQNRMPTGQAIEVLLSRKSMWIFRKAVGRLRVMCVSPVRELLKGEEAKPMATSELNKVLGSLPPSAGGIPSTLVIMSTSGFTREAHEVADRRADRTVILVAPNEAGGWSVTGPTQTKALADLFDPEAYQQKRQRLIDHLEANKTELTASGLAADRVAARTQLSPQFVEAELKAYAKENPGLVAKRLDGRVVMFREGAGPAANAASGGSSMPLLDRMRALFARKGETEKKIAFLSERRTALSQQRDRAYEEMGTLEQQEESLRRQFKDAGGTITKRRVTSQLLQLRKDVDRRQQLLAVLNQQIDVVSTHLHNLGLVQQGKSAQLPDAEEMTADAVKAEEMLAELEANTELAGTAGAIAQTGMSEEEQALFDELERESGGGATSATAEGAASEPEAPKSAAPPQPSGPSPAQRASSGARQRRGEAEPG